ncbi:MAG: hypothetical protein KGZ58_13920 [Ignavibacteriales bacterium]|nr:hypothetical protein [Ignavibacteriales bacterium]
MKKLLNLFSLLSFIIFTPQFSSAQSLEETLQKLAGSAAQGYVGPIVSGFGSDLNGGWFHKAPEATKFSFDLEFGFVGMATFFEDANKSFSNSGSFRFDSAQATQLAQQSSAPSFLQSALAESIRSKEFNVSFSGPTIIGKKSDNIKIIFSGTNFSVSGNTYNVPGDTIELVGVGGLLDGVNLVPLGAPQVTIGTVFGTQFAFRYLPSVEVSKEIGKFEYFGFGIQHNPFMWIPVPEPPVDVSLGFFTQTMKVGTIFETKATAFGINASKSFGPGALKITPYAGFMVESSEMTFTFDYDQPQPVGPPKPKTIEFTLEGENTTRITLGLSLKLLFMNFNADYNLGKYNSITGGFMFII